MLKTLIPIFFSVAAAAQPITKAKQYYENGQLEQAHKILLTIDDDAADYHVAQYYLGRVAFDSNELDDAADYFEEAIDHRNDISDYHLWYGNALGTIAQDANIVRQGFLAPKIKAAFEQAVALDSRNRDALWGLVQYYTQAPGFMGGSYQKALDMAGLLYQVDKVQGYLARATVYQAEEKFDLVEKQYQQAAGIDPVYYFRLGYFYQQHGRYDEAFDTFDQLSTYDEHQLNALYQIGRTSAFSGKQAEKGVKALQQYLQADVADNAPSHAAAKMRLGMIYEKTGQKTQAIRYYEEAVAADASLTDASEGLKRLR